MSPKIESNCSVTNLTKGKLPSLPFVSMKDAILGKKYELSVVIASRDRIKRLNFSHRGKNTSTDILSFPLSETSGEIFLNLDEAKKEAKKFGREFENFICFLFIHGLAHLEGFQHGSRMESIERKYRKQFRI